MVCAVRALFLVCLLPLTIACGSSGPLTRDYNYKITTPDPEVKNFIIKALEEYNRQAGKDIVGYTEANSRSTISIIPGKILHDGKSPSPKIGLARYAIKGDVTYGEIEFDFDYVKARSNTVGGLNKEGFILVTHEQGHVLGLDHVKDPTNMMDPVINNADKNIPLHFVKAVYSYNQDYPTNVI